MSPTIGYIVICSILGWEVLLAVLNRLMRRRQRPAVRAAVRYAQSKGITDEKILLLGGRALLNARHKYLGYIALWIFRKLGLVTAGPQRYQSVMPEPTRPEPIAEAEYSPPSPAVTKPIAKPTAQTDPTISIWLQNTQAKLAAQKTNSEGYTVLGTEDWD